MEHFLRALRHLNEIVAVRGGVPELPYLPSPGSVDSGLEKVRSASEPQELTTTNVGEMIGLKGGNGANFVRLLKKLGMIGEGGKPSDLYRRFRGEKGRSTALADAIRTAYAPLFQRVEDAHALPKDRLEPLVVEVTGAASDARSVELIVSTFQRLVKHADFQTAPLRDGDEDEEEPEEAEVESPERGARKVRKSETPPPIMLAHNIHLNLPDTTDIRVFDAIFRSLREHLMR